MLGKTVILRHSLRVSDIDFEAIVEDQDGNLYEAEVSDAIIELTAGCLLVIVGVTRDYIETVTAEHGIPIPVQRSDIFPYRQPFTLN